MTALSIVDVKSGDEVATAALDGGAVTYGVLDDVARGVVERYAADHDLSDADAVRRLAVEGWSNGYLMVALPDVDEPVDVAADPAA
jgi:hypothetical protein